jgi:hypothetical protein
MAAPRWRVARTIDATDTPCIVKARRRESPEGKEDAHAPSPMLIRNHPFIHPLRR